MRAVAQTFLGFVALLLKSVSKTSCETTEGSLSPDTWASTDKGATEATGHPHNENRQRRADGGESQRPARTDRRRTRERDNRSVAHHRAHAHPPSPPHADQHTHRVLTDRLPSGGPRWDGRDRGKRASTRRKGNAPWQVRDRRPASEGLKMGEVAADGHLARAPEGCAHSPARHASV